LLGEERSHNNNIEEEEDEEEEEEEEEGSSEDALDRLGSAIVSGFSTAYNKVKRVAISEETEVMLGDAMKVDREREFLCFVFSSNA
jgi:hypothetical protein